MDGLTHKRYVLFTAQSCCAAALLRVIPCFFSLAACALLLR
jgi:hypothetical protein